MTNVRHLGNVYSLGYEDGGGLHEGWVFDGHNQALRDTVALPSGLVVTTSRGSFDPARVWNADTGAEVATLEHETDATALAVAADGRLITGDSKGTVRLWNSSTWQVERILDESADAARTLAPLVDGRVAVGGAEGTVRLWDPETGSVRHAREGHLNVVERIVVLPGDRILTVGFDDAAHIRDQTTGEIIIVLDGEVRGWKGVAITPGGMLVTCGQEGGTLWDAATGTPIRTFGDGLIISQIGVMADGRPVTTDYSLRLGIWDPATGQQDGQVDLADSFLGEGWITAVAQLSDHLMAIGTNCGEVAVWDPGADTVNRYPQRQTDEIQALTTLRDGRLISSSDDGTAVVHSPDGARSTVLRHTSSGGATQAVRWLPGDRPRLVTSGSDGTARIWDAGTFNPSAVLLGHVGGDGALEVLPDGRVVGAARGNQARIWDPDTGESTCVLTGHTEPVRAVATIWDGRVVTGSSDGTARVWDAASAETIHVLEGHTSRVVAVAAMPNGQVVTGSWDETARIWDADTGKCLRTLKGHREPVTTVAALMNGQIVTGSWDKTARIWDASTGECLGTLDHDGWVSLVLPTQDDQILTVSDGALRRWDIHAPASPVSTTWLPSLVDVAIHSYAYEIATVGWDGHIRILASDSLRQVRSTMDNLPAAHPHARAIADLPAAEDALDVQADVVRLARLLAARTTSGDSSSLAVALMAEWGTGKSSFMTQLRSEVTQIARRAGADEKMHEAFVERVVHVTFNAWHYSDTHVLVGMIEQVFQSLREQNLGRGARDVTVEAQRTRDDASRALEAAQHALDEARRARTRHEESGAEVQGPRALVAALWGYAQAFGAAARSTKGRLQRLAFWLGWAALVVGGVLWVLIPNGATQAADWVGGLIGLAGLMTVLRDLWARGQTAVRTMDRLGTWVAKRREADVARLRAEEAALENDVAEARALLATLDPVVRLAELVDSRRIGERYEKYNGHIAVIHEDLQHLASYLTSSDDNRARQWSDRDPLVERIILYVDDLDRCSPDRVIEVLHAVNLLQAIDLFMVVVSVDAKWLRRSLAEHDRDLFAKESLVDMARDGIAQQSGDPLQYLDKIFQIPFALHALTTDTASSYLRKLAEPIVKHRPRQFAHDPVTTASASTRDSSWTESQPVTPPGGKPSRPQGIVERDAYTRGSAQPDILDRRPAELTLTPHEVRYLADMSPLLSTPRAVKKLLNLYQLVRAGVPEDDLDGVFLERNTGEYREVAILLAMLVGVPSHAAILLDEILNGPASQARDLSHIVAALRTEHKKSHVDVNTRQVRQCPACLNWHRIEAGLTAITGTSGVPSSVAAYRRWAREISRYSFHTESLWTSLTPEQQNEATKGWREV